MFPDHFLLLNFNCTNSTLGVNCKNVDETGWDVVETTLDNDVSGGGLMTINDDSDPGTWYTCTQPISLTSLEETNQAFFIENNEFIRLQQVGAGWLGPDWNIFFTDTTYFLSPGDLNLELPGHVLGLLLVPLHLLLGLPHLLLEDIQEIAALYLGHVALLDSDTQLTCGHCVSAGADQCRAPVMTVRAQPRSLHSLLMLNTLGNIRHWLPCITTHQLSNYLWQSFSQAPLIIILPAKTRNIK